MINVCSLQGRLCRDVELRVTTSGTNVAGLTIAVERSVKNQDGTRTSDFIPLQVWGERAVMVEKYFKKGRMINVTGSIRVNTYTKSDGTKGSKTVVIVDQIAFGGDKLQTKQAPQRQAPQPKQRSKGFSNASPDDYAIITDEEGLPF